jgi:hypothetical protein
LTRSPSSPTAIAIKLESFWGHQRFVQNSLDALKDLKGLTNLSLFLGGNTGSIPVRDAKEINELSLHPCPSDVLYGKYTAWMVRDFAHGLPHTVAAARSVAGHVGALPSSARSRAAASG